eukprot:CAMPEP_0197464854 /NCGR_PEP_ID=MMETSP1175-20131217/64241_1 /TAXON_ID=1003142 /ORGANISM="Triceratium dubium, Strain CCMP147" /LENGTH=676 /DNA_ID=CAMNT_0043000855 /DNA_START=98 /DNA_END=2126 /DNA_ORIENTATION=+
MNLPIDERGHAEDEDGDTFPFVIDEHTESCAPHRTLAVLKQALGSYSLSSVPCGLASTMTSTTEESASEQHSILWTRQSGCNTLISEGNLAHTLVPSVQTSPQVNSDSDQVDKSTQPKTKNALIQKQTQVVVIVPGREEQRGDMDSRQVSASVGERLTESGSCNSTNCPDGDILTDTDTRSESHYPALSIMETVNLRGTTGGETQSFSISSVPCGLASTMASTAEDPASEQHSILWMRGSGCNTLISEGNLAPTLVPSVQISQVNSDSDQVEQSTPKTKDDPIEKQTQVVVVVSGREEQREDMDSQQVSVSVGERLTASGSCNSTNCTDGDILTTTDTQSESHYPALSIMETVNLRGTTGGETQSFSKLMYEAGSIEECHTESEHRHEERNESLDPPWSCRREFLERVCASRSEGAYVNDKGFVNYAAFPQSNPKHDQSPMPSTVQKRAEGNAWHGVLDRATVGQLGDDSFIASVRLTTPLSLQDIRATIANPELLTDWFEPIEKIYVSSVPSTPCKETERVYDGEWIEASTSALVLPKGQHACLHRFLSSMRRSFGFPLIANVSIFVERQSNQVVLKIGPYGSFNAIHTLSVHDVYEDDRAETQNHSGSGLVVTDVIYLEKDEETDGCCGLLDCCRSRQCDLLRDLACQAAASLDMLRVLVAWDSRGFSADRGGW